VLFVLAHRTSRLRRHILTLQSPVPLDRKRWKRHTTSLAPAAYAGPCQLRLRREVRQAYSIRASRYGAPRNVEECVLSLPKVSLHSPFRYHSNTIDANFRVVDNPLSRCHRCKAAVPSTDAILDAIRIGHDALDKATSLQFKGMEYQMEAHYR
jgi:hypothetical protein